MKYTNMTNNNIGQEIITTKLPSDIDWQIVGEITFPMKVGEKIILEEIHSKGNAVRIKKDGEIYGWFPIVCFSLNNSYEIY